MDYFLKLIAIFKELYTQFRRDYVDFIMVDSGSRNYVCMASIKFKASLAKVPYYLYSTPAFQRSTPTGYLNDNMDNYYFREVPFYVTNGMKDKFLPWCNAVFSNGSGTKVLELSNGSLAVPDKEYIRRGLVFTITPYLNGQYRRLFVNYDPALMDVVITTVQANVFYEKIMASLYLQKQLQATVKELTTANNKLVAMLNNPKLPADLKEKCNAAHLQVYIAMADIKNDPNYIVKICTECATQPTPGVGVLPLIAWAVIAVVAWYGIDKLSQNAELARQQAERLKVREINAQRITSAVGKIQEVLTDSGMTAAQKATVQAQLNKEMDAAAGDSAKQTTNQADAAKQSGNGFFDNIQSLLWVAGGFLILNNLTKK